MAEHLSINLIALFTSCEPAFSALCFPVHLSACVSHFIQLVPQHEMPLLSGSADPAVPESCRSTVGMGSNLTSRTALFMSQLTVPDSCAERDLDFDTPASHLFYLPLLLTGLCEQVYTTFTCVLSLSTSCWVMSCVMNQSKGRTAMDGYRRITFSHQH